MSSQLPSREFNLTTAVEYLRMAGYNAQLPGQTNNTPVPIADLILVAIVVVVAVVGASLYIRRSRERGSLARAPPPQETPSSAPSG